MKMINNYLSNLESYLPDELKTEVREELESSIYGQIEDQQAELGRELNEQEQEQLLRKIGHPMRVASAYLPNQQLVGHEYFPAYKKTVEIALAIVLGISVITSMPWVFTADNLIGSAISLFAEVVHTGLYVFAIITIIFYFLQQNETSLDEIYAWSPKNLKHTYSRISISRMETLFEMIVEVLFLSWWNDLLTWPSAVTEESITATVSLSPEWAAVFWSVNIIFGLSLAINFHKLVIAGWNKFTLATNMALNLATLVVLVQIAGFEQYVIFTNPSDDSIQLEDSARILENVVLVTMGIIATIVVWDTYSNFRKMLNR
ncbi:hypothetical protein [Aliikangiella coralliicola]|uniref:Uncharacterized protein n=1 Tax=Aliikangiella coralliicola TaxID=2592383 RepID=A0A545UJJ3_9GAMM|nr:hypothetical protein [Aliikangiella coralliicola]TQV89636.1 hypothetical protein FLL46_01775 [Aliikangiella coralliicola]